MRQMGQVAGTMNREQKKEKARRGNKGSNVTVLPHRRLPITSYTISL